MRSGLKGFRSMTCLWVLVGALAACGGGQEAGSETKEKSRKTLTIYSSLLLQGASRDLANDLADGAQMALDENRGRAGAFAVKHVSLDDSTAQAGSWDPGQTAANARKAVLDKTAIAYLGDYNSGASAISILIIRLRA